VGQRLGQMMGTGYYNPGVDTYDHFYHKAVWRSKFICWPKRSAITRRWLWLQYVYEGTAMYHGPGEAVFEFRYHEPIEHLIWKLKQ
jgi:hypothetical protein